jgi:hypothetical protein
MQNYAFISFFSEKEVRVGLGVGSGGGRGVCVVRALTNTGRTDD